LARWAQEAYRISERHAARIVKLGISTLRYQSRKVFDWERDLFFERLYLAFVGASCTKATILVTAKSQAVEPDRPERQRWN
jgi:hypothetical protein